MSDTVSVNVRLLDVERFTTEGSLKGMATVLLDFGGAEIVMRGVQMRETERGRFVRPPAFRHPGSGRHDAVLLPPEVAEGIRDLVMRAWLGAEERAA